mmetsp:Transcript_16976/g.41374  ORF Transcript_16976/g.41374 Transcript_16976/m.41374 type:complete len:229 (-) Transcript_16976:31-717(-)
MNIILTTPGKVLTFLCLVFILLGRCNLRFLVGRMNIILTTPGKVLTFLCLVFILLGRCNLHFLVGRMNIVRVFLLTTKLLLFAFEIFQLFQDSFPFFGIILSQLFQLSLQMLWFLGFALLFRFRLVEFGSCAMLWRVLVAVVVAVAVLIESSNHFRTIPKCFLLLELVFADWFHASIISLEWKVLLLARRCAATIFCCCQSLQSSSFFGSFTSSHFSIELLRNDSYQL